MKKIYLLTVLFAFLTTVGFSQSDKFWSANNEIASKIVISKGAQSKTFPKTFKLFNLNLEAAKQQLFTIVGNSNIGRSTTISLPNTNGDIEQFEVFEASNFDEALQVRFPSIRAFSGKGITDKGATLKLSISPNGIQTMIFRTDKASEFIEAYSQDRIVYAVFNSNREKGQTGWTCTTDDQALITDVNAQINNRPTISDGFLRTIRLAQSCNGEYATYFGASTAGTAADQVLVLAAINATLTRCNGVYEKDLALHLNLIPTTTAVLYYDPTTDPYTTQGAWNGQLQGTLNANIGAANYDIGHMFGASGGGGNAGCIGCVCNDANKGSGITSPGIGGPEGDNFDIDYVVHEIGHQIGGTHTFSMNLESSGTNKEVGSGITIMGYAGITGQDVAPHSIDIYHQTSIQQIQNNLATKVCPVISNLAATNSTPIVSTVLNRTIPKSTPFLLTGSASDANSNDVLTYCWEQNDNSTTTGANSVASPTKATGPNWLSFSPTTNPSRTCPILPTILAGGYVTGPLPGGDAGANIEALSSIGRNLNFRLTVRDNANYIPLNKVAQTAFTDMIVTVDATTGPFQVTVPNTPVSWSASTSQTITWDVAGTTGAPINCSDVKISLSYDGGFTFPVVLAASTTNDGTEALTLPATLSTTARIKIESVGNIFFDISNTNFTIAPPPTDFNFGAVTTTTSVCPAPASLSVNIPTTQIGGFANMITLSATAGVPAGATVTFSPNPVAPGASSIATLNNANTLIAGTYVVTVSGTATGASTKTINITYTITAGAGPIITAQPAATSTCVGTAATFTVASSTPGVNYQWQVALAATPTVFNNIVSPSATTATLTTALTAAGMNGNVYHCNITTQCSATTSNNAALTVNTPAAVVTAPTAQSVCTGSAAIFNVTGSGTGVTYQWFSATLAAGPFSPIAGGTTNTLNVPNVQLTTPGFYQVILTTTVCPFTTLPTTPVALTISATAVITTQPQPLNNTVCAGSPFSFTAAATGTGITYQWQVATAAAPTAFTSAPGASATSATYTGTAGAGMNGNIYRVVVTGACNTPPPSNPATLTVNTAAALGAIAPSPQTVCNGVVATFTGSGTGTGVTYQWQSGPSASGPWLNVTTGTGGATQTYTTVQTTPAMNNTWYQLVSSTTICPGPPAISMPVKLTVNTVAVIGTQPAAQTACIPQSATFNVAATGTGLTYQWQMATAAAPSAFADITGATGASYTTPATILTMNGNKYRVNILSTCSPTTPTTSNDALLTVQNPVSITAQPTNQSGCSLDNYTFGVTAVSPGNVISYQWQVSTTGIAGPYNDIAGATSASYSVNNAPLFISGNWYRAFISVPCGTGVSSSFSNAASINLSNKPTVVLTKPTVSNTNAAVNNVIVTTVSPFSVGQTATYTWKKNGTTIPNTLASTSIVVPVDDAGSYQVSITDAVTGCTSLSNIVVTDALTSDNLLAGRVFIYPNPVSTKMIVRYNNSTSSSRATSVVVYDEKGSRVLSKAFTVAGTNGRMEMDMSTLALGTYIVYVVDASGKKLATSKAIKVQ